MSYQSFYTLEQLRALYAAWGVAAEVPTAKLRTVIAFSRGAQFALANITRSGAKSTYGKALYSVELSNPVAAEEAQS